MKSNIAFGVGQVATLWERGELPGINENDGVYAEQRGGAILTWRLFGKINS